jgi:hypothetical protein
MQLQQAVNNTFVQLAASLQQLTHDEYSKPCKALFGNSIGQHVRHIIELFQSLEKGYDDGIINYENRNRDLLIETNKIIAEKLLSEIHSKLNRENKDLKLEAVYDEHATEPVIICTNYYREVAYNLEHTIHHMALIRVGVTETTKILLPESFGVASSTVKYRKQCVQ